MSGGARRQEPLAGFDYVHAPATSAHAGQTAGLMLLHGTGGDEHDLLELGAFVAPGAQLVSPRGRAPERGMNRWFARHAEGVLDVEDIRRRAAELAAFIPAARQRHGIDEARLWAIGFSNGANMAAAMLLLYPGIFAGAVLLRPMLPLNPDDPPELTGTPVLIAAGTEDTMIPGDSTRELIALLKSSGADVTENWVEAGHRFGMDEVEMAREWYSGRAG